MTSPMFPARNETEPDSMLAPDAESIPVYTCDRCGSPVVSVHCKILCHHCGFMRDCSDP